MPNIVLYPDTGHIDMTGTSFIVYANRYREAAVVLMNTKKEKVGFDPVVYFLFCLSVELYLKSFIWLCDRIGNKEIKHKYNHNIERLWDDSQKRGIHKYARPTTLRNRVITLVGLYYRKRQLNYLDLDMIFKGYQNLKSEPIVLSTLNRLTNQLSKSLRDPVLHEN